MTGVQTCALPISGQTRNRIAQINATGQLTAWNPNASSTVNAIVVSGTTVYAGGTFTNIGRQSRSRITALDAATGNATAWDPSAESTVNTITVNENTIYVGGAYTFVGGQLRNNIAALDATVNTNNTPFQIVTAQKLHQMLANQEFQKTLFILNETLIKHNVK